MMEFLSMIAVAAAAFGLGADYGAWFERKKRNANQP